MNFRDSDYSFALQRALSVELNKGYVENGIANLEFNVTFVAFKAMHGHADLVIEQVQVHFTSHLLNCIFFLLQLVLLFIVFQLQHILIIKLDEFSFLIVFFYNNLLQLYSFNHSIVAISCYQLL